VVALARKGEWLGVFAVRDRLRSGAAQAVADLQARGWRVALVTGDGPEAAEAVAEATGITEVHARQLPEDKLRRVREAQERGEVVAVAGDGLNDGPVLAGADVSFAMGAGVQAGRISSCCPTGWAA
jgi:Cu2+-exporting ATPase